MALAAVCGVPMSQIVNVYCDESCHLENDKQKVMVLGAVWCPSSRAREIAVNLRSIKSQHGLAKDFEVKWTKISPAKVDFYWEVIEYFLGEADIHFRALVVPDKSILRHDQYDQDHDTWYYKMYFDMLKIILDRDKKHRIYVDIKDTHSNEKLAKLKEVLRNNSYDYDRQIIDRVQAVRSDEVEQVQLTDLLIGLVGYANRELKTSTAKVSLVERLRRRIRYQLTSTTLLSEKKFNLLIWQPRRFCGCGDDF